MIPYVRGDVPKQAHVGIPTGLYEEEFGRKGFFGSYAHIYRSKSPLSWTRIEGDLRPRSFDLNQALDKEQIFPLYRKEFLRNQDLSLQFVLCDVESDVFYRNADGDEIYFIHEGQGTLFSDFGSISYTKGDYLVIPRGTVYLFKPQSKSKFLIIESKSEIRLPEKGMLGQHALFDPALIEVPSLGKEMPLEEKEEYQLSIKRLGKLTHVFYPHCPLNTVAWKGTLSVWKINVADIRPISCDRYHLPPSVHTTFVAQNFVVCSFLPRPLENGDPKARKVPFYHSNIDYDEVIFYHSGDFFSREGIDAGMVTLHPQGIHHGPQDEAVERSVEAHFTNEVAVMIDARNPLEICENATQVEFKDYWKSWQSS